MSALVDLGARGLGLASAQVTGGRQGLAQGLDLAAPGASDDGSGRNVLVLVLLLVLLYWGARVLWFPFIHCRWCGGNGKRSSKARPRTFRRCWHCRGKGSKLRLSRRLFAYYKIGKVPR